MNNKLLASGKYYDLMINWNKRIENEIPLIKQILSKIKQKNVRILEIGCGTGIHAFELSKLGFEIISVDIDSSMIDKARERCPDCNFILGDIMQEEIRHKLGSQYDIIISLGNTFGLIAANYGYEAVIQNMSHFLKKPHGILFFQVLNTEIERNSWSNPRTIIGDDGEYIFLRGFKTSEDYIHPEILTLYRALKQDSWQLISLGSSNIPRISSQKMMSILKKNGFSSIEIFGDYKQSSYDPKESTDMIVIAH